MSLSASFKAALLDMVRDYYHADAVEIIKYDERMEYGGYCETCSYEEMVLDITYRRADGTEKTSRYFGGMAEILDALLYREEHNA